MRKLLLIFTLFLPIICSDVFSEDDFDKYDEVLDRIDLTCFYDRGFLEYKPNHPLDVTYSTDGKNFYIDGRKVPRFNLEKVKKKTGENIFIHTKEIAEGLLKEIYIYFDKGRVIHWGVELNCY